MSIVDKIEKNNINLFEIAIEEYFEGKKNNKFDEDFKLRILTQLNDYFIKTEITEDTIVSIVNYLEKMNPNKEEIVSWKDLSNLKDYVSKDKRKLTVELNQLLNGKDSLKKRIERFRLEASRISKNYDFGTSFLGYIFASFDREKYTTFIDKDYKNYCDLFFVDREIRVPTKYNHQSQ